MTDLFLFGLLPQSSLGRVLTSLPRLSPVGLVHDCSSLGSVFKLVSSFFKRQMYYFLSFLKVQLTPLYIRTLFCDILSLRGCDLSSNLWLADWSYLCWGTVWHEAPQRANNMVFLLKRHCWQLLMIIYCHLMMLKMSDKILHSVAIHLVFFYPANLVCVRIKPDLYWKVWERNWNEIIYWFTWSWHLSAHSFTGGVFWMVGSLMNSSAQMLTWGEPLSMV